MINWSGIQASMCIRISTLTTGTTESSIPGREARSSFGIPGLGYREKPVLDSAFCCNPLRTAAANGKRIHPVSAYQELTWNQQVDLSNETQLQQESLRVTVGIYKIRSNFVDWIGLNKLRTFFCLIVSKFISGKIIN